MALKTKTKELETSNNLRGTIDFAIITIKEEEYEAVLAQFPPTPATTVSLARHYDLREVVKNDGTVAKVAVTRCPTQGNGVSQEVFRDITNELDPQWVLCVGIAGGVPASEFSLGDVLLGSRVLDMSVEAIKSGEEPTYAADVHAAHTDVENYCTAVRGQSEALGDWARLWDAPFKSKRKRIREPSIHIGDKNLYGDAAWRKRTREALEADAETRPRLPRVSAGLIAASDRLIKDDRIVARWLKVARQVRAVEMESAGVYRAATGRGTHRKGYPAMTIRGISDIVGFKRDEAWTRYACISAAAFAYAFVKSGYVKPRPDADAKAATDDGEILAAMARALDRPAFYTPFAGESSIPDFKQAITDTIEAIGTGVRHTRGGVPLDRILSRHDLKDPATRATLAKVERGLANLRTAFDKFLATGDIKACSATCKDPNCPVYFTKPEAAREMDRLRAEIIETFRRVYPALEMPRLRWK